MSAAYTPGPWSILPNGHCVSGPDPMNPEIGISGVAMCGMARRTEAEARANARLIAAAPDLLAALQWALDAMAARNPVWTEGDRYGAARAAIEKAVQS